MKNTDKKEAVESIIEDNLFNQPFMIEYFGQEPQYDLDSDEQMDLDEGRNSYLKDVILIEIKAEREVVKQVEADYNSFLFQLKEWAKEYELDPYINSIYTNELDVTISIDVPGKSDSWKPGKYIKAEDGKKIDDDTSDYNDSVLITSDSGEYAISLENNSKLDSTNIKVIDPSGYSWNIEKIPSEVVSGIYSMLDRLIIKTVFKFDGYSNKTIEAIQSWGDHDWYYVRPLDVIFLANTSEIYAHDLSDDTEFMISERTEEQIQKLIDSGNFAFFSESKIDGYDHVKINFPEAKNGVEINTENKNEKVYSVLLEEAKRDKAWAQKVKNDKKWIKNASQTSIDMMNEYLNKTIEELADDSYKYLKYRSHATENNFHIDKPARDKWERLSGETIKYKDGGEIEQDYNAEDDLFQHPDKLPLEVREVIEKYAEIEDADTYEVLRNMKAELEPLGYTFDYYLDAEPYNLRKITDQEPDAAFTVFKQKLEDALFKKYAITLNDTGYDDTHVKLAIKNNESIDGIVDFIGNKYDLTSVAAAGAAIDKKSSSKETKTYICIIKDRTGKEIGSYPMSYNDEEYANTFLSAIGVKLKASDTKEIKEV